MPEVTVIKPKVKVKVFEENVYTFHKRKVAGYARVSTDRDEQFASYEAQVEYYTRYIKSHSDWEFVKVYTDEGITGTSTKHRAGFNAMVDDAISGKIDLIVTKSISRFARNTVDSLTTIRALKEHGTEVYFEKENIWTFDGKGELLIAIMSSLAQEESRSISENVTWGMREAMRQGKASVPYKAFLGYDKDQHGNMVVNEEQARIVRKIYGLFLQGRSPYNICRVLEDQGVKLPNGNDHWYTSTIRSILTNEKYRGDALRQKTYSTNYLTKKRAQNNGELQQYYIHNHHEAIISPELFDRIQEDVEQRNINESVHGKGYLLSKRVKCADCGSWYGPVVWRPNTKNEKIVWRCNKMYAKGKPKCSAPAVTEDEVKTRFIKSLNSYFCQNYIDLNILKIVIFEHFQIEELTEQKSVLQNESNVLKKMLETSSKDESTGLQNRISDKAKQIDFLTKMINENDQKLTNASEFLSLYDDIPLINEFAEDLWFNLVDHVTIYSHELFKVIFKDGSEI